MANIPSLGELTYKAQPEIGGGQPGVVIDNSNTVRALTDMANVKAQNDWNKYLLFQDNLKDVYKNLGDISGLETATQDKEYLTKQMGEIFQGIAENPRAFFSGGSKYAEIQGKIAKLRSEATESKMNQVYDFAHRQYMTQNPELNTPENQQKINSYWSQPLGKRQAYMLDMPTLFDYPAYMKEAMTQAASPFAKVGVMDEATGDFVGDKFITTGTKYDRDKFLKTWMTGLDVEQDKYGHSIRGYAQQQYNKLSPEQKKQYPTLEDFWRKMGESAFGSGKDITDISKIEENKGYFDEQKLGLEAQRTAAMVAASKALQAQRYASAALSNKKNKLLDQQFNPPEVFDEVFQGKMQTGTTNTGRVAQYINRSDMTKQLQDVLGLDPVDKKGNYYVVPANITIKGKQMDEATAYDLYKQWINSDQAKEIAKNTGVQPTIFDALYANGANFKVEVEGKVPTKTKSVDVITGYDDKGNAIHAFKSVVTNPTEAGKVMRSDRLQAWIEQRKELGIKGDKLLTGGGDDDESATEVDQSGSSDDNQ